MLITIDERQSYTRALIGAVMIFIGTLAAMLAVPVDFDSPGALTVSSYIMALGLIGPTVFSWKNDLRSLLRGENILLFALIYWTLFELMQGAFAVQVSRDAVVNEFVLLGLTGLGFWLGASVGRPLRPRIFINEALTPWSNATVFRLTVIAFLLGAWDFVYRANFDLGLVFSSLFLPRFEAPWQREALGDWSAFSGHLQYFGYTVPALAVLCAVRCGRFHPFTLTSWMMALATLALNSQGGGRRVAGTLILSALFCWLLKVRHLTWARIAVVVVLVIGLLAFMQVMLLTRNVGFGEGIVDFANYEYLHVDGNFYVIAQMMEFVPDVYPYVGWDYVIWAIVRPIPRIFWPGKPVDSGFDLAEVLGIPNTTLAISAAGEFYLSYGFLATIVGGWVYGRLATIVNSLLEERQQEVNPVFPSLVLVWLFVGVRSMLEIMLLGYVLVVVILMGKLTRFLGGLRPGSAKKKLGST